MKIIVKGTNLNLTPKIYDYIEEKIGGLDKFLEQVDTISQARVELGRISYHHKKGEVFRCEVNLTVPGKLLRSEAERENIFLAIDEVKDELQREIKKYKGQASAKQRRGQRMFERIRSWSPLAWLEKRSFKARRDRNI